MLSLCFLHLSSLTQSLKVAPCPCSRRLRLNSLPVHQHPHYNFRWFQRNSLWSDQRRLLCTLHSATLSPPHMRDKMNLYQKQFSPMLRKNNKWMSKLSTSQFFTYIIYSLQTSVHLTIFKYRILTFHWGTLDVPYGGIDPLCKLSFLNQHNNYSLTSVCPTTYYNEPIT